VSILFFNVLLSAQISFLRTTAVFFHGSLHRFGGEANGEDVWIAALNAGVGDATGVLLEQISRASH